MRFFFFLLLFISINLTAEDLPTLPTVELVVRSKYVAIAEFSDDNKDYPNNLRFNVLTWLKKTPIKISDQIVIRGFSSIDTGSYLIKSNSNIECSVDRFLLFFNPPYEGEEKDHYDLFLSGFRGLSKNGEVLYPLQLENPGPYRIVKAESNWTGVNWPNEWNVLLDKVKEEIERTEQVFALRQIENMDTRNEAILGWIEKHLSELKNENSRNYDRWGSLTEDLFKWVWSSGRDTASWRVLLLRQQLDTFFVYPHIQIEDGARAPFGNPDARRFFIEKINDPNAGLVEKRIAVFHLNRSLWTNYYLRPEYFPKRPITKKEQSGLADLFAELIKHDDPFIKETAILALVNLVNPPDTYGKLTFRNDKIVEILKAEYRNIPTGRFRNEFVQKLVSFVSGDDWEKLTGNPDRMLVIIYHFYHDPKKEIVKFNLRHVTGREPIISEPTVVAEKLNKKREVEKIVTLPATPFYPKTTWEEGRSKNCAIQIHLPAAEFSPGIWRFKVEGTVGKFEDSKWTSEPWELEIGN